MDCGAHFFVRLHHVGLCGLDQHAARDLAGQYVDYLDGGRQRLGTGHADNDLFLEEKSVRSMVGHSLRIDRWHDVERIGCLSARCSGNLGGEDNHHHKSAGLAVVGNRDWATNSDPCGRSGSIYIFGRTDVHLQRHVQIHCRGAQPGQRDLHAGRYVDGHECRFLHGDRNRLRQLYRQRVL